MTDRVSNTSTGLFDQTDQAAERKRRAEVGRMRGALFRIAHINDGPDQASAEFRCTEAAAIAREALKE